MFILARLIAFSVLYLDDHYCCWLEVSMCIQATTDAFSHEHLSVFYLQFTRDTWARHVWRTNIYNVNRRIITNVCWQDWI